jgi:hypothetical protein
VVAGEGFGFGRRRLALALRIRALISAKLFAAVIERHQGVEWCGMVRLMLLAFTSAVPSL